MRACELVTGVFVTKRDDLHQYAAGVDILHDFPPTDYRPQHADQPHMNGPV